jgi:hypothetical protein
MEALSMLFPCNTRVTAALIALLVPYHALASEPAPEGVWRGQWGGNASTMIEFKAGVVTRYLYQDKDVPVTKTSFNGHSYIFGNGEYEVRFTLDSPERAHASYKAGTMRARASLRRDP